MASGRCWPEGICNVTEIKPGKYKLGLNSRPKLFSNPKAKVDEAASEAILSATKALEGIYKVTLKQKCFYLNMVIIIITDIGR